MTHRIGVDMGCTAIKAGVIDENNRIIEQISVPTHADGPFETVVETIARAAKQVAELTGLTLEDFPCLGVGLPSTVDPRTGLLVFCNNAGWKMAPFRQELERYVSIPVHIGNDANCAVIGEALAGAARGCDNVVMLTLGTGVGGGVILNGKLFYGADGNGAELGHVTLVFDGEHCTCGLRGCIEAYASVTAFKEQTRRKLAECPDSLMHQYVQKRGSVSGFTAFDCAKQGDKAALEVVDRYAHYLSAAIGSFVTIFRPEIFIIGGGLSNEKEYLLDKLNTFTVQYTFAADVIGIPPIVKAELGNDAGMIGAANLDKM